jgi:hypothetical protein
MSFKNHTFAQTDKYDIRLSEKTASCFIEHVGEVATVLTSVSLIFRMRTVPQYLVKL